MDTIQNYNKPQTLKEAISMLIKNDNACIIAGGTDLLLQIQAGNFPNRTLIDISELRGLAGISLSRSGLSIGAVTKLSDIEQSSSLKGSFEVIKTAASLVGSPQIRNMATIGGNLCNASPSADMSAPLLVLDAQVEIISNKSKRLIQLSDFFLGPSQTIIEPGEILTAIKIPNPPENSAGTYLKHSARRAMELAIVGVSVLMWRVENNLRVRLGLSAVAPTAIRARKLEHFISGVSILNEEILDHATSLAVEEIRPISDVRASELYRKEMVISLTKRAITEVYSRLS